MPSWLIHWRYSFPCVCNSNAHSNTPGMVAVSVGLVAVSVACAC